MNKYILKIHHQSSSLLSQSYCFDGDIIVLRLEEDDKPPFCMITSPHLSSLDNPTEIWARSLSLINLYNGSNNLFYNPNSGIDYYNQKITGLYIWETDRDITPNNTIDIIPSEHFDTNLIDYPLNKISNPKDKIGNMAKIKSDKRTFAIYLAKSNLDVKNLLLQLGQGLEWINLYCILDTVKFYSKLKRNTFFNDILIDSKLTQVDVKAFSGTANNFGLIGFSARHGNMGWTTPVNTVDLKEGQNIILSLTKSYLKLAHNI